MKNESMAIILKKIGVYNSVFTLRERFRRLHSAPQIKKQFSDGGAPLPRAAIIEVTNRCNMSCGMCWLDGMARTTGGELRLDEIIKLIERLPSSIREITITGGEPLLRDDIHDICKHIKQRGFDIMLLTNGFLTDRLTRLIRDGLLKKVNISLDGTAKMHNSIRGQKDAFKKAVESMKMLMKEKNLECHFLTVINETNLRDLKQLVGFLKKNSFNNSFMVHERRYDERVLDGSIEGDLIDRNDISHLKISDDVLPGYSFDELKSGISDLERCAASNSFFIRYLPNSFVRELAMWYTGSIAEIYKVKCDHFNIARIDTAGNLIPCFAIRKKMGNLLTDDFLDLWNSKEFSDFRFKLLNRNLLPLCSTCYLCYPWSRKEKKKR